MLEQLLEANSANLLEPGIIAGSIIAGSGIVGKVLKNFLDRYLDLQSKTNQLMDKLIAANQETVTETKTLIRTVDTLVGEMRMYNKKTDRLNSGSRLE